MFEQNKKYPDESPFAFNRDPIFPIVSYEDIVPEKKDDDSSSFVTFIEDVTLTEDYQPNNSNPLKPPSTKIQPPPNNPSYITWFNTQCKPCQKFIILMVALPVGLIATLAFGLLVYSINELIKNLQEDKDTNSILREATVILPTLFTTSAATWFGVGLLVGASLSPLGLGLVIFATVSITSALFIFLSKKISDCLYNPYKLWQEERKNLREPDKVQKKIDEKVEEIQDIGLTFFCSYINDSIREKRREIRNLRDFGDPDPFRKKQPD